MLNDRVAMLLSGELATAFLSLLTSAFFSILMFYYDPVLALVGILIAVLNFVFLKFNKPFSQINRTYYCKSHNQNSYDYSYNHDLHLHFAEF